MPVASDVRLGERVARADDGREAGEQLGWHDFDGTLDDVHAALTVSGADYSADLDRLVHVRILLRPHPEEQRSCVSKEGSECTGSSFETALSRLLRMRLVGESIGQQLMT